ncbi:hypothetical protein PQ455_07440 [Sphingomonas naphthae]|uniref:Uncharacterized protein n=1 Tax=Sphingomonas naphthae TaxID=1813468 RepID=A0ABY7TT47_9SPHN|nr:hypothetical protein [Sphingomonas naphthae]WCT75039.1 hypothetical protein PQ455_07440 [Sphingomonas naphthae]
MRAIIMAIGLLATPALAADQFDLICTAKKTTVRYRVDLARGEWCDGDCKVTRKITAVTTGFLTLVDENPTSEHAYRESTTVNRVDGSWYTMSYFTWSSRVPSATKGTCEPTAFTGFPAAKF